MRVGKWIFIVVGVLAALYSIYIIITGILLFAPSVSQGIELGGDASSFAANVGLQVTLTTLLPPLLICIVSFMIARSLHRATKRIR